MRSVAEAGLQLAMHTNGERCQEQVCGVAAGVSEGYPVRLEHGGNWVWDPATPDAWRRGGAVPVPQPVFIYTMAPAMPQYLGPARRACSSRAAARGTDRDTEQGTPPGREQRTYLGRYAGLERPRLPASHRRASDRVSAIDENRLASDVRAPVTG
jgi:hypothetical protein